MPSERRARQRANRQQKHVELEQEERRDRFRQYGYVATLVGLVVVAAIGIFIVARSGDDGDDQLTLDDLAESAEEDADKADEADDVTEPAAGPDEADSDATAGDDAAADDTAGDDADASIPCPAEDGSSDPVLEFPAPPPDCLTPGASYTAVFDTSVGEMVAELDPEQAPITVNNFVYLARYHYYDGSTFHRVIQDFVIQGGDPVGDPPGTGGPGYTIDEEVPEPGEYELGSLVMAKRTPPSTTGAQFFVVTGPNGEALPNQYSLFGQVTEGLDVAEAIQTVDTDGSDKPLEDVVINSITIIQS